MEKTQVIIENLDALLSRANFGEAGMLLYRALAGYLSEGDTLSAISIYNEIMGFERQYGTNEKALSAANAVMALLEEKDMTFSRPAAYIYLNCATVYKNAGDGETALSLYERAEKCFNRFYPAGARDFSGLYNNMAACFWNEKDFPKAEYYYLRAAGILERHADVCDLSVTYFNLAELYSVFDPLNETGARYGALALKTMDIPENQRDAYFYYTCRKAEDSCKALGYFPAAENFKKMADDYYARA